MDLSNYSTEELYDKVKCCAIQIDMTRDRIRRITQEQQDICDEELEYQTEIDRREIAEVVDWRLPEQTHYFLHAYNSNRSTEHYRKCTSFFDILSLSVEPRNKNVRWNAPADFIKLNRGVILQYLQIVFDYTKEHLLMETIPFHLIRVTNNKMVERISYYPKDKTYSTEGVHIRHFNTLEEVLDYMMEEV